MSSLSEFESLISEAQIRAAETEGWDFSWLKGRRHEQSPPWSYEDIAIPLVNRADHMLDMDTGGGERLTSLHERASAWPIRVEATEAYPPNIPVARRALEPIDVTVVPYTDVSALPFDDGSFDVMLNRHGSYSVPELYRLLDDQGLFVSEQVGSEMCQGLNKALDAAPVDLPAWNLNKAVQEFESDGFEIITAEEHRGYDLFDDVGAIVWYLQMV
ncbi:MAG: SAM-dependent methyltransferase, partial [Pseudomonadales bacterium]|nr:SAM-dependent methyltransferase [Pseudomonadales bacterium]